MTQISTLGEFADGDGTPIDLPDLHEFPATRSEDERLLGLRADRTLVYHKPPYELWFYDADTYVDDGAFDKVDQSNTGRFGSAGFDELHENVQDIDWLATTEYASIFVDDIPLDRYPETLPDDNDIHDDDRPGERLLGIDSFGLGHYEVHEIDIPAVRRYAPFSDGSVIHWNPRLNCLDLPDHGPAHRRTAHYVVTTEVDAQGWAELSKYGQQLVGAYLDEFEPVRQLVE